MPVHSRYQSFINANNCCDDDNRIGHVIRCDAIHQRATNLINNWLIYGKQQHRPDLRRRQDTRNYRWTGIREFENENCMARHGHCVEWTNDGRVAEHAFSDWGKNHVHKIPIFYWHAPVMSWTCNVVTGRNNIYGERDNVDVCGLWQRGTAKIGSHSHSTLNVDVMPYY